MMAESGRRHLTKNCILSCGIMMNSKEIESGQIKLFKDEYETSESNDLEGGQIKLFNDDYDTSDYDSGSIRLFNDD